MSVPVRERSLSYAAGTTPSGLVQRKKVAVDANDTLIESTLALVHGLQEDKQSSKLPYNPVPSIARYTRLFAACRLSKEFRKLVAEIDYLLEETQSFLDLDVPFLWERRRCFFEYEGIFPPYIDPNA